MHNNESWGHLFEQIAVNDDTNALEQLFMEFYPPLCVFAKQYIDNDEVCKDVVQDTFFILWQKRKQINVRYSLRNYLATSVRNRCVDLIRKKKLTDTYLSAQKVIPVSSSPEEVYSVSELKQLIEASLQTLPENIRHAFELNRFQNKTYVEIAGEMNVSVKTIESYISRALKILRESLKDYLTLLLLFLY